MFKELNNLRMGLDDYFTITGMSDTLVKINGYNMRQDKLYLIDYFSISEYTNANRIFPYPITMNLGTEEEYFKFDITENEEEFIQFSNMQFNRSMFAYTYIIEVYTRRGKKIFSQYIMPGQYVYYWGKLMVQKLNTSNVKVTDYLTITKMTKNDDKINNEPVDQSKRYVFGKYGIFPREI